MGNNEKDMFEDVLGGKPQQVKRKIEAGLSLTDIGGRIPPQAIEMEQAILGALMLESSAYDRLEGILKPQMFYKEGHKLIFEAITSLVIKEQPVDLITVKDEMSSRGTLGNCGGIFYLTELTSKVASAANILYHAQIMAEKFILRESIKVGSTIVSTGFDDTTDPFELLDAASDAISAIRDSLGFGLAPSAETYKSDWLKSLEESRHLVALAKLEGRMLMQGMPTGLKALDVITGGFEPGLYILGARPGMGKTIVAINIALEMARAGHKVYFFALEMDKAKLINRLVSAASGINGNHIKSRSLTEAQMQAIRDVINSPWWSNIIIDDMPGQTDVEIAAKMRTAVRRQGVKAIIIDYLQLIGSSNSSKSTSTTENVGKMLKLLRNTARKLKVPLIGFSQVARETELMPLKIPELRHLPDSKHYEQDADFVAFLYRPAYYRSDSKIRDHFRAIEDGRYAQTLFIIIAKQRDGEVNVTVPACITVATSTITDIYKPEWLEEIGRDASWIYGNSDVMKYIGVEQKGNDDSSFDPLDRINRESEFPF